jgi:hemerythrin-like domain-containing protein
MDLGDKKMNVSREILNLMVKDHCKIQNLLDDFEEKTKQDHKALVKSFHKFEWELEKHVFVEEKAIFTTYNPEDVTEGYKMLPELTKQHNIILNKLSNMRQDILKRRSIQDISGFKEFLTRHKNYEEQEVYPQLDEALDESQKKIIIDRINEIVSE